MAHLLRRLRNGLAFLSGHAAPQSEPAAPAFERDLRGAGITFEAWLSKSSRALYVDVGDEVLGHLKKDHAGLAATAVAAADGILEHRFDLLGSGPFIPADAGRAGTAGGYRPIDWYLDPVRGLRFPQGIRHTEWNLQTMRPGNADIKYPWELARCQHWPLLAQGWRLTGEAAYAQELADELDDFMSANPVGWGINWTCTMDVAIRALNWAVALQVVRGCHTLDGDFWRRGYEALYAHGHFVFANLENKYEVTSNHFLSNVVGLYYLASVFRSLEAAPVWDRFCRDALEREMVVQVMDDGADYESSVPYHRLVAELFLGAARLADWRGEPLSQDYRAKLKRMIEFLAGVLRPDGLMPQVGDADDGRLHVLSEYGCWNPQDPRHLFAPAALTLDEPRWLQHCGPAGAWEAAWWGFDVRGMEFRDGPAPDAARLFPSAGLAVVRKRGTYLIVSNGIVGTKGFGNHKHNDQLGFELHLDGRPLLVDPGSFVYTGDPDARNLFRGTAYHNTVMVDAVEQNELRPEWLFRLFESSHAEHVFFEADDFAAQYRGRHSGYTRLSEPVMHERTFRLSLHPPSLTIVDRFDGRGVHDFSWHFHAAPGVAVKHRQPSGEVVLEAQGRRYRMRTPDVLNLAVRDAWYSPSYGVRVPCVALQWEARLELAGERCLQFDVTPLPDTPAA